VWVRDRWVAYEWEAGEEGEGEDKLRELTEKERMWVIIKGAEYDVAVGVVYMGVNSRLNKEWNERIWERLEWEIGELKQIGFRVVLAGDFNGHIGKEEGEWGRWGKINTNGRKLLRLAEKRNMVIANRMEKCTGKYTWSRGATTSVVDFILVDERTAGEVVEMVIDDNQSRWSIASDHCFIRLTVRGGSEGGETAP